MEEDEFMEIDDFVEEDNLPEFTDRFSRVMKTIMKKRRERFNENHLAELANFYTQSSMEEKAIMLIDTRMKKLEEEAIAKKFQAEIVSKNRSARIKQLPDGDIVKENLLFLNSADNLKEVSDISTLDKMIEEQNVEKPQ